MKYNIKNIRNMDTKNIHNMDTDPRFSVVKLHHIYILNVLSHLLYLRGMFEMNCFLSSSSISTWGTIKINTYLYRVIQYLHNGV